jgi:hypothetical protein
MKTLLLFFILLSTTATAQLSKLIERYPDLDTLQVLVDKAPYYKSPKSTVPTGNLRKNTIVYSIRMQNDLFAIADDKGEFIGFISPLDVDNLSIKQLENQVVPVATAPQQTETPRVVNPLSGSQNAETINYLMLKELEKANEQAADIKEDVAVIRTILVVEAVAAAVLIAVSFLTFAK